MTTQTVQNPPAQSDVTRFSQNLQATELRTNGDATTDVTLPGGAVVPSVQKEAATAAAAVAGIIAPVTGAVATVTTQAGIATAAAVNAQTGTPNRPTVRLIATSALPANTYANGTAGVGATITVTATGTLTIDGKVVAVNDSILVTAEAAPANNGFYTCTTAGATGVSAVLTRRSTENTPATLGFGCALATDGATLTGYGYRVATDPATITIGTTAISIVQAMSPLGVSGEALARVAADALKVDKTTSVTGGGLVTGGGSLSGSIALSVTEASDADVTAGISGTLAVTPRRLATLVNTIAGVTNAFLRFVDSISGNDSYDGLSSGTAKKTFAQVLALAGALSGIPVGIARSSKFTSELDISAANARFGAYGSLYVTAPIFDDSHVVTSWTATAGQTNVWQASVTLPGNSKILGNVFLDGAIMPQVTSVALCASTVGSAYMSNWAAATAILYIQSATDPNTNGHEYRHSYSSGLFITGDGALVEDFIFRRNGHQDGSLRIQGMYATVRRVRCEYGCRHSMYAGLGLTLENSYFQYGMDVLESGQGGNGLIVNQADFTLFPGVGYSTRRNTYDGGPYTGFTGIGEHDGVGNLCGPVSHTDEVFINNTQCFSNASIYKTVLRPTFSGCISVFSNAVSGATVSVSFGKGDVKKMCDSSAGVHISSNNALSVPDLGAGNEGFYRLNTGSGDIHVTADALNIIASTQGVPAPAVVYWRAGNVSVFDSSFAVADGSSLAVPFLYGIYAGFSGGTAAVTSGRNIWPFGTNFLINGTTYQGLTAAQAAGYEIGSTVKPIKAPTGSDNFARADENLDVHWTRFGGLVGTAGVRSNMVAVLLAQKAYYQFASFSVLDRYLQARVQTLTPGLVSLPIRGIDELNWVGLAWSSTQVKVQISNAGTITTPVAVSYTLAIGDVITLAIRGNSVWIYVNDKCIVFRNSLTLPTALTTAMGLGFWSFQAAENPVFDQFAYGVL